jgi:hypothetical protein
MSYQRCNMCDPRPIPGLQQNIVQRQTRIGLADYVICAMEAWANDAVRMAIIFENGKSSFSGFSAMIFVHGMAQCWPLAQGSECRTEAGEGKQKSLPCLRPIKSNSF